MEKERENLLTQLEHQKAMKAMELESEKIGSKWTIVFKLPMALIKLPVALLVGLVLGIYAIRGIEPPESLTSFIRL
jgi:hypothetical protein